MTPFEVIEKMTKAIELARSQGYDVEHQDIVAYDMKVLKAVHEDLRGKQFIPADSLDFEIDIDGPKLVFR